MISSGLSTGWYQADVSAGPPRMMKRHYGFQPKACRPYRARTKGKVERPYRYIREDFFLARSFRNLDDLNAQLRHWLDTVANPRVHATTQRVVNEAFAEEKLNLNRWRRSARS